ncbi:MAG TPA: hypothetical protein VKE22_09430 [Haliangiales bacterium]|nr:hypothetical protein [Haliangiales bacterium]
MAASPVARADDGWREDDDDEARPCPPEYGTPYAPDYRINYGPDVRVNYGPYWRVDSGRVVPSPRHFWVRGHWARFNYRWVWIPGHWELRRGNRWDDGYRYRPYSGGWYRT